MFGARSRVARVAMALHCVCHSHGLLKTQEDESPPIKEGLILEASFHQTYTDGGPRGGRLVKTLGS